MNIEKDKEINESYIDTINSDNIKLHADFSSSKAVNGEPDEGPPLLSFLLRCLLVAAYLFMYATRITAAILPLIIPIRK